MKNNWAIVLLTGLWLISCQSPENPDKDLEKEEVLAKEVKEHPYQSVADSFSLDYIMGKFDPSQHPDFVLIDPQYANREGRYLHKDTYEAFKRMHAAAKESGINLRILSATRNFESQKGIWEAKWTGQRKIEGGQDASIAFPEPKERALKILKFSSMPSTSRHHWGTDIDLNALVNSYFEKDEGLEVYEWLLENAASFGFCQPYTEKGEDRPFGYNEEKWHWSYMPISRPLTWKAGKELKNEMISGFLGKEVAVEIDVVNKYVLGVNTDCK